MNLEKTIKHLLGSDASEFKIVGDFFSDFLDEEEIPASCDLFIEAATMVKKAIVPPKLIIASDTDGGSINPRKDWDHLGTMFCWHNRYELGDHQPRENSEEWLRENGPFFVQLPLYLYDHSGLTMSTGPFACPWDSGQVGWIVVKAEDARKEFSVKALNGAIKAKVAACLEAEVKVYDQYLRGAVWGYVHGDDSCWGFFGDELEETGMLEHIEAPRDVVDAAWEARS